MKNRTITLLCAATLAAVQIVHAATITVTNTTDSGAGSLRDAIATANNGDSIVFGAGVSGFITLTSGHLAVNSDVTISGPGASVLTIDGHQAGRIFFITSGRAVTISGLTMANGNVTGAPAGQNEGGAIYNDRATLTLNNCVISGNAAQFGAGIRNNGGTLRVNNCTLSGNLAVVGGGGIYSTGDNSTGASLTLNSSTISGNSAPFFGGGIYNKGDGGPAVIQMANCTVSGNTAQLGGGVDTTSNAGSAALGVNSCTFSGNSASGGNGGAIVSGTNNGTSQVSLRNTILKAGSSGTNLFTQSSGTIFSQGYNLSSDNGSGFLTGTGDQINTDPQLGPLQNNGGPTFTHALLSNSPAINAGTPTFDPNWANPPLVYDQRGPGFPRVAKSRVDIGAFEYPLLVTNTSDSGPGSLRQALLDASNVDTVFFAAGLTGTITLTTGELLLNKDLTISGPGANVLRVNGNNVTRIFHVTAGHNITISGLTIRDGSVNNVGAAIYNEQSSVTVDSCALNNNANGAGLGGAVFSVSTSQGSAAMTITNSILSGNSASQGGAIANEAAQSGTSAALTLINSTLSNNSANSNGGGIYNEGFDGTASVTVVNCTFTGNADSSGGGSVYNAKSSTGGASVSLYNTILKAGAPGGNIFNFGGTITSLGYNISSDNGSGFLTGTGDQINTDPQLGPLQDNGGPTLTYGLLSASPAINAGDPNFNPSAFNPPLLYDQRGPGFWRVAKNRVDIGAFESPLLVTNTNDSGAGSLRQAVMDASSVDTILFAAGVTGTITLTTGEIALDKDLNIAGPGANLLSVSGNNASRVFNISSARNITLSGLTIENGNASGSFGGGIISDHSNLTIQNCMLTGNSAANGFGGAIFNDGFSSGSARLTLTGCTLSNNSASQGGGIFNGGNAGFGLLRVINCTFSGNSSANFGGALYNEGSSGIAIAAFSNSTLSENSAAANGGGGVFNQSSTGTVIFHNTILKAGSSGANIANSGSISSSGYNLSSDNGGGYFNATGDQINTDPQLGPLQNNGGPTLTHALLPGSPAINAGDPNFHPGDFNPPLDFDQRGPGFARIVNGRLDIGAFEVGLLMFNSATSLAIHGPNQPQPFAINLPLSGNPGIECRSSDGVGGDGSHIIEFTFSNAISSVDGVSTTCGPVTGIQLDSSNGALDVIFDGSACNGQYVTVTLTGVHDAYGQMLASASVTVGLLLGDTTGNGFVNSSDIAQTQSQSGQPLSASNFREDVNVNGQINSTDISVVQAQSGTALGSPPAPIGSQRTPIRSQRTKPIKRSDRLNR
jgi:fibronectin-binding autotransporter adhesin